MRKYLLLFLLSLLNSATFAQTYKPPAFADTGRLKKMEATYTIIDHVYKAYAEKNHWPGMAYGVVVDGKLVHSGSMGFINIDAKIGADPQSDFRIASMTKSLTAMAILKLRDEGKLKLDDPAYLYIPEMKDIHYLTKDATPVTIRNLLTHAAGYPEDNPWGDRRLADSDDKLIALYKKSVSFSNDPGLNFEYSNLGYATLGFIIKQVSGKTYQDYITENILKPLGMTHTFWEYDKVPKNKLAHGYGWQANKWVEQPLLHDGAYGAMGGLISTVEDFSKYVAVYLNAWPPRDDAEDDPIKRSSIREMQFPWNINALGMNKNTANGEPCPSVSAYGYGLNWAKDCEDRVYIFHSGGLPGFGSNWKIMPEYGVGVFCFVNLTYANASAANNHALDSLLTLSGIKPRQLPSSAILDQRKSEIIKVIADWDIARSSGIFAENFFSDYSPRDLKAEALDTFAKAGKIISIGEMIPENQLRGYFIFHCEKADIRVTFTLTPENPALIQSYDLEVNP
jgi:CubicO group peptidase (beta-lactamase class C family)